MPIIQFIRFHPFRPLLHPWVRPSRPVLVNGRHTYIKRSLESYRIFVISLISILTPAARRRRRSICGMAELGEGPHRSGDIATCLGQKVSSLAPMRSSLIAKSMVCSPNHGDTGFIVPMFEEFMKRIMPDASWR